MPSCINATASAAARLQCHLGTHGDEGVAPAAHLVRRASLDRYHHRRCGRGGARHAQSDQRTKRRHLKGFAGHFQAQATTPRREPAPACPAGPQAGRRAGAIVRMTQQSPGQGRNRRVWDLPIGPELMVARFTSVPRNGLGLPACCAACLELPSSHLPSERRSGHECPGPARCHLPCVRPAWTVPPSAASRGRQALPCPNWGRADHRAGGPSRYVQSAHPQSDSAIRWMWFERTKCPPC